MCKFIFAAAAPLAALLLSNIANAATNSDLSVTARVLPSACTLSLANGGVFDFDDMFASTLAASGETALPAKTQSYTISCTAATHVGLKVTDNQAGTSSSQDSNSLGLGTDAAGNNIGYYAVHSLDNPVVNNSAGNYLTTSTNGAIWSLDNSSVTIVPLENFMFSFIIDSRPGPLPSPIAITSVAGSFKVDVDIAPKSELDLTRVVNLNGSATLELVYI